MSLMNEEGVFRQLVEMAPNAIVMVNESGLIELVNIQAEKIFGYDRADMIGQSIDILLPERFRKHHSHHRHMFLSQPSSRSMGVGRDLFGRRQDGSEFPLEIGLNPIATFDGIKVISSIVDISERKAIEMHQQNLYNEIARINEELNNFTYVSSHDLKSPLRGIDQLASWIAEDLGDSLSGETKEHLRLMRSRINRMEKLLDDLLAYSRAGRSDSPLTKVNVAELIRDVFDLTTPNKRFQLDLKGNFPIFVTKKAPLELVFRNLIGNAIKHHDKPAGTIVVSGETTARGYEFSVADDGPGIPREHQQRVFGMFQTLKPRDELEGSGMGLAMVKKTIESEGGVITVESDGHRGCTFRFTWPVNNQGQGHDDS